MRAPEIWCAHGVRERAVCKPLRQREADSTVVVQRFANAAQRCGRIDRPLLQLLANRTFAYSMRAPGKWRAHG
eukprot:6037560-Lingulodinium_polyedra.AAC.1